VRSLANYCFDLRFARPRMEQILGRMMTIAAREKLKISKDEVEQIIKASHQDMRQSIYSLQLMAAGKDSTGVLPIKDVSINIFEAARQLMCPETDIFKKRELFFTDYSLMPLFVQENYLHVKSSTLG
jgi:replication factor C subunit 1